MPESEMSVEAQLFDAGVRQYLNLLIGNVEFHPNFKKATEGLDLSLSMVIKLPESFKRFNISDPHIHLHIADQRVEFDVGAKPSKADVVIEGEWTTWKNVLTGQEDLIDSVTDEKIRISGERMDKLSIDLLSVLADGVKKSTMPPEVFRLVEPTTESK